MANRKSWLGEQGQTPIGAATFPTAEREVGRQVKTTYYRSQQFFDSLPLLIDNVQQAQFALRKNIVAIKALNGTPLEATASMQLLATARREYLDAVVPYNQWQLRLVGASGQRILESAPKYFVESQIVAEAAPSPPVAKTARRIEGLIRSTPMR